MNVGKTIRFSVPPNSEPGTILVSRGSGQSGINGGPNGDAFIKLNLVLPRAEDLTDVQRGVLSTL